MEPERKDNSVDKKSTLFKFAKQNFGVELSSDLYDDNVANSKPSGKGSFATKGYNNFNEDRYGMDIACMNIFDNQVIPVAFTTFQKGLDQIWLQFKCYLWAQSSFLSGIKQRRLILLNGSMNSKTNELKSIFFRVKA